MATPELRLIECLAKSTKLVKEKLREVVGDDDYNTILAQAGCCAVGGASGAGIGALALMAFGGPVTWVFGGAVVAGVALGAVAGASNAQKKRSILYAEMKKRLPTLCDLVDRGDSEGARAYVIENADKIVEALESMKNEL